MRTKSSLLLATALAAALAAPAAAGPGNDPQGAKDQTRGETAAEDCGEGNTFVAYADDVMWPPNHKYQPVDLVATDADGGEVTVTSSATHDEYLVEFLPASEDEEEPEEEVGAGNTRNDARPFFIMDTETAENTNTHELRSERSGRGDGREYTIDATATFDDGECDLDLTIVVPHDMRSDKAPAKADKTDSTGPDQG